jgi:hypothetical protein
VHRLDDIRGVDNEHEMVVRQAIRQHVVDERPLRRGQRGILRLMDCEAARVIRRDVLDRRQRVRAGDLDFAHVADVEQSAARADGHVLVAHTGVFDRHVPTGELHHARAERSMPGVQRRLLERTGSNLRHQTIEGTMRLG